MDNENDEKGPALDSADNGLGNAVSQSAATGEAENGEAENGEARKGKKWREERKRGRKPGQPNKVKREDAPKVQRKAISEISDTRALVVREAESFAKAREEHLRRHPDAKVAELPADLFNAPLKIRKKLPPKLCENLILGGTHGAISVARLMRGCNVVEQPTFDPEMVEQASSAMSEASQYIDAEKIEALLTVVTFVTAMAPFAIAVVIEAKNPGSLAGKHFGGEGEPANDGKPIAEA